jgi:hypothetical protein
MCDHYDGLVFPSEEVLKLVDIHLHLETTETRNGLSMWLTGLVADGLLAASIASSALPTSRSYQNTGDIRAVFEPSPL